jgi:hypothetical protein
VGGSWGFFSVLRFRFICSRFQKVGSRGFSVGTFGGLKTRRDGPMGPTPGCFDRMPSSLDMGIIVRCSPQSGTASFCMVNAAGGACGLPVGLPSGDRRLAHAVMRRFSEERGRYQKQDCKRQEGRRWSVQPHHVLRGAERQSNSYLRESLCIV